LQQLQAGRAVLVFPEGERTPDGQLHTLQPGVQLLIKRARTPVVPVGIAGAYAAWPRRRSYPIPSPLIWPATDRTIAISIGPALEPDRLAELPRPQLLAELEAAIRSCVEQAQALRRKRRS
ncbi:MAG TPA: lysophospholipid acyltransferase family protein, partial [Gemmataceae bacterium]|nr:lysophospholipid acyltransferase family protein [Gemmataceae bacterium]